MAYQVNKKKLFSSQQFTYRLYHNTKSLKHYKGQKKAWNKQDTVIASASLNEPQFKLSKQKLQFCPAKAKAM